MVAFKGHFDGKVIVPDEPVALRPNERVLVRIEPLPGESTDEKAEGEAFDFRSWIGLGNRAPHNPNPRFTSDDELWEK